MFNFAKRPAPPVTPEFAHSAMPNAANSSQAAADIQRELVRVAFQDTLRATGVPPQWLDCAVRYIKVGKHEERLQIQLVIKKWSDPLLRYSMAFQNALIQCLDRYEPGVDHSEHEWLWRYAVDCESRFPDMPPPESWTPKQLPQQVVAPPTQRPANPMAITTTHGGTSKDYAGTRDFGLRDIFSDLQADTLHASGSTPLSAA